MDHYRLSESVMTRNRPSSSNEIAKPRVKPTVIPVPISDERLVLHRGPFKAEHQLMVLSDPGGLIKATMDKMDGTRNLCNITTLLQVDGFSVSENNVVDIIEMLAHRGVIADDESLSSSSMSDAAAARYSRNLNCWAAITSDDRTAVEIQAEIGRAHVLVLGVGGIGTAVAQSLVMAGCGQLTLVDFDVVELSKSRCKDFNDQHQARKCGQCPSTDKVCWRRLRFRRSRPPSGCRRSLDQQCLFRRTDSVQRQ
jgi:hypothetical protein